MRKLHLGYFLGFRLGTEKLEIQLRGFCGRTQKGVLFGCLRMLCAVSSEIRTAPVLIDCRACRLVSITVSKALPARCMRVVASVMGVTGWNR
jgi:hypothetical protein